jgi:hypothetical protein
VDEIESHLSHSLNENRIVLKSRFHLCDFELTSEKTKRRRQKIGELRAKALIETHPILTTRCASFKKSIKLVPINDKLKMATSTVLSFKGTLW